MNHQSFSGCLYVKPEEAGWSNPWTRGAHGALFLVGFVLALAPHELDVLSSAKEF